MAAKWDQPKIILKVMGHKENNKTLGMLVEETGEKWISAHIHKVSEKIECIKIKIVKWANESAYDDQNWFINLN